MKDIAEFFASNPEAMATLIVFAVGGLGSTVALLYSLFVHYPLIVRTLGNRSLVYVDSALREKVQVVFDHGERMFEVRELRQVDFEMFNSHPRSMAKDCTITINLPSPDVTVLGVTAANGDNRTPTLGGRKIMTRVEAVPVQPVDPILGSANEGTYPAVVVQIPYLERVLQNDRVFLRITYDGPELVPEVQGAKTTTSRSYRLMQRNTVSIGTIGAVLSAIFFLFVSYRAEGIPFFYPELLRNPFMWASIVLLGVALMAIYIMDFRYGWIRSWLRPISSPLTPPPTTLDSLTQFHFYDTILQTDSD